MFFVKFFQKDFFDALVFVNQLARGAAQLIRQFLQYISHFFFSLVRVNVLG